MRHDAGPWDADNDGGKPTDAIRRVLGRRYDECRDAKTPEGKPRDIQGHDSVMGWITTDFC